jgi:mevalonate kinase
MEVFIEIMQYVLLGVVIYLIKWATTKFTKTKEMESILKIINEVVLAAEEAHRFKEMSSIEKMEYAKKQARELLDKLGLNISDDTLEALIKAAVKRVRDNGQEEKKGENT